MGNKTDKPTSKQADKANTYKPTNRKLNTQIQNSQTMNTQQLSTNKPAQMSNNVDSQINDVLVKSRIAESIEDFCIISLFDMKTNLNKNTPIDSSNCSGSGSQFQKINRKPINSGSKIYTPVQNSQAINAQKPTQNVDSKNNWKTNLNKNTPLTSSYSSDSLYESCTSNSMDDDDGEDIMTFDTTYKSRSKYSFEWQDDNGKYYEYDSNDLAIIRLAYKSNPKGKTTIKRVEYSYEIDFSKSIQTNLVTMKTRKIRVLSMSRKEAKTKIIYTFEWEDDGGKYYKYDDKQMKIIQIEYNNNPKGTVKFQRGEFMYEINFSTNVQTNLKTKKKRKIKVLSSHPIIKKKSFKRKPKAGHSDSNIIPKPVRQINKIIEFEWEGDKGKYHKFEMEQMKILQKEYESNPKGSAKFRKSEQDYEVNFVKKTQTNLGTKNTCKIKIIQAEKFVDDSKTKTAQAFEVWIPEHWDPQENNNLLLIDTKKNSTEWMTVEKRFQETCKYPIIKIERIQNIWLLERYQFAKKNIRRKNSHLSDPINELQVFHGTKNIDPKRIYSTEEGFDMRFSNKGMWGYANYFAQNSQYSVNYAYEKNTSEKQMLQVSIIAGDVVNLSGNNELKMPPIRPKSNLSSDERYDTVSGTTLGSKVYMLYTNERAYPEYLITYKHSS